MLSKDSPINQHCAGSKTHSTMRHIETAHSVLLNAINTKNE